MYAQGLSCLALAHARAVQKQYTLPATCALVICLIHMYALGS